MESLILQIERELEIKPIRKYLVPLPYKEDNRRKLSEKDILEIRESHSNGETIHELAKRFSVTKITIKMWVDKEFRKERLSLARGRKYLKKRSNYHKEYREKRNKYLLEGMKESDLSRIWAKNNPNKIVLLNKKQYEKLKHPCLDCKKLVDRKAIRCKSCVGKLEGWLRLKEWRKNNPVHPIACSSCKELSKPTWKGRCKKCYMKGYNKKTSQKVTQLNNVLSVDKT